MPLRVAIVEDDLRWRTSLESLLRETGDLEFVGSCGTGEEAIKELPRRRPQIVLMDINLPKMSGVECTRQLRALLPEIQIIMLTVYDDSDRIFQALQKCIFFECREDFNARYKGSHKLIGCRIQLQRQ